ncbi:MAG: membrane protein insertase YidC [Bdellovibrionota bacterium]
MEDKKTALALFLCFIIVVMYSELFLAPDARRQAEYKIAQQNKKQAQQTAETTTASNQAKSQATTLELPETIKGAAKPIHARDRSERNLTTPSAANYQAADKLIIDNGVELFTINLLGARVQNAKLTKHTISLENEELYDLISNREGSIYPLGVYAGAANDNFSKYTVKKIIGNQPTADKTIVLTKDESIEITLTGTLSDGTPVDKIFTFTEGSYYFIVEVAVDPTQAKNDDIWLEWSQYIPEEVLESRLDPFTFSVLESDNSIEKILVTDEDLSTGSFIDYSGEWVALGGKYFTTALVPSAKSTNLLIGKTGDIFLSRVRGTQTGGKFFAYAGPKITDKLQAAGLQLERSIDLGWFSVLAHPLLWLLKFFYSFLGNYGLAIIALTLFIKILFLPLTKVQFQSMRAMQELQPEIKALKERIKEPNQLNQEMMALYKKRGVNPMGGCIPMLIQLPVFLGLYNALLNYVALRHAPFALWINDLSAPESLEMFGIGVPVMIIIMGLSMIVQQWTNPSAGDPAQKKAMMMMPVVFTVMFIVFPFPSGLVLYWLVNNVISIIQQTILTKERKVSPLQATLVASAAIFALGYILTLL